MKIWGTEEFDVMNKSAGFSLLELTIALLVIGLMVGAGIQILTVKMAGEGMETTRSRADSIKAAMEAYYFETGYYPWPANPALAAGAANFGKADNTLPVTAAPTEVVQGAVPFADLKIPAKYALDGWGNKFTYAVSRAQTSFTAPAPISDTGVITVTVPTPTGPGTYAPLDVSGVHWVLISHGNLGDGAYTASGTQIPCPATASVEKDNCDNDAHFYMSGATDADHAARSLKAGAGYMDDYTLYVNKIFTRYWISPTNTPAGETNAINTVGVIGINTDWPGMDKTVDAAGNDIWVANGVDFDVNGVVRTTAQGVAPSDEKGTINGTKFCDGDGNNCFGAEKIGGVGLQDCALMTGVGQPRAGMSGIGNNSAKCIGTINNLTIGPACSPGTNMTGLSATGAPICN